MGGWRGWPHGPKKWRFEGWGAQRVGGPKFRAFFFPSPAAKLVLFFPLWGSSRGILVVFLKRRGAQMCTFGVLGLSCEAPAAPKPPGFHTTAQEPKRVHLRVLQNTTKIQREDPQRGKRTNFAPGEGKKKSEILGGPGEGRSREGRSREGRSKEGRSWEGRSWEGRSWEGRSWEGRSWEGRSWEGRFRGHRT